MKELQLVRIYEEVLAMISCSDIQNFQVDVQLLSYHTFFHRSGQYH